MKTFLSEFKNLGFFKQATDEAGLEKAMQKPITAYIGFDCTADSLHVGSLIQIMIIRKLLQHGHKAIILLGGGTTKIGDPSGRDKTRQILDQEGIERNKAGIKKVIEKFIPKDISADNVKWLDNDQWLSGLQYIDFLRDVGRHFSVNRMLSFDSVSSRLEREQNLSFLEFNYMILQAYDFVVLNKEYGCNLQIGGSDQWGNIVNGIELARRLEIKDDLFGLTTPLITTSSGAKMGKSASGAMWLDADKLSPYEYYQFWRNTEDADTIRFIKFFTELEPNKIAELEKLEGADINEAKKILAFEATKLCHGQQEAQQAEETAINTFEQNSLDTNLPTIEISKAELIEGINFYNLFVKAELCQTGGEAKRLIKGGGGKINDKKIIDAFTNIASADFNKEAIAKLSAGKKKHALIKLI